MPCQSMYMISTSYFCRVSAFRFNYSSYLDDFLKKNWIENVVYDFFFLQSIIFTRLLFIWQFINKFLFLIFSLSFNYRSAEKTVQLFMLHYLLLGQKQKFKKQNKRQRGWRSPWWRKQFVLWWTSGKQQVLQGSSKGSVTWS